MKISNCISHHQIFPVCTWSQTNSNSMISISIYFAKSFSMPQIPVLKSWLLFYAILFNVFFSFSLWTITVQRLTRKPDVIYNRTWHYKTRPSARANRIRVSSYKKLQHPRDYQTLHPQSTKTNCATLIPYSKLSETNIWKKKKKKENQWRHRR